MNRRIALILTAVALLSPLLLLLPSEAPPPAPAPATQPTFQGLPQPIPEVISWPTGAAPQPVTPAAPVEASADLPLTGVFGRVFDKDTRQPLTDALLRLESHEAEARIDARGRFAIAAPPGRPYKLRARAPGYLPTQLIVRSQAGTANLVELPMEACETGTLEVEVTYMGEAPAEYKVWVVDEPYVFPGSAAFAVIEDVPVGRVRVGLSGRGPAANIPLAMAAPEIRAGEVTRVALTVPPQSRIQGRILDHEGEPLAGAQLTFGPIIITSEADGAFDCGLLFPGLHKGTLYHPDYGTQALEPITLKPGEQEQRFEWRAAPQGQGRISGEVANRGSEQLVIRLATPAPEAAPGQRPAPAPVLRVRLVQEGGAYEFPHLPAGRYIIEALQGSWRAQRTVELGEAESLRVDFDAAPSALDDEG